MFENISKKYVWKKLKAHNKNMAKASMREMFENDKDRSSRFSIAFEDLLFDYSKNIVSDRTMRFLCALAKECRLKHKIKSMFNGEKINFTENRSVLHIALRNRSNKPIYVDGKDVMPQINAVLDKMRKFSEAVRLGKFKGHTGKKLTKIVNIGIGGSDLGPFMAVEALKKYVMKGIECHFISNIDGTAVSEVLDKIDPETTLFVVSSKTFTTIETLTNARTCRKWLVDALGEYAVSKHFVAISTNKAEVEKFGIDSENMFEFWDFVGGRYSIWSAIGLSVAIAIGMDNFERMLEGAHAMDKHFLNSDYAENIPVIMGLLGVWYNNFFNWKRYCVVPYDQYLKYFPNYLQQMDMESNGKFLDAKNKKVNYDTGPVIFGGAGTDVQHSFFQLIHQGTAPVPCDFIIPAISHNEVGEHHEILIANVLAQAESLMRGKTEAETAQELRKAGKSDAEVKFLKKYKSFEGNRPSNMFVFRKINPYNLGMLLAMYEHKVFVQGVVWNINSYDQMGVELGKQMALEILPSLQGKASGVSHDGSTKRLVSHIRKLRK